VKTEAEMLATTLEGPEVDDAPAGSLVGRTLLAILLAVGIPLAVVTVDGLVSRGGPCCASISAPRPALATASPGEAVRP
jgi:hypothetical protein